MDDRTRVQLMAELRNEGYARSEVLQRVAAGDLARVRWGAYAGLLSPDPVARHLQLIQATVPRLSGEAVVSHASAAACHTLPVWEDLLTRVHVTRTRSGGRSRGTAVHTHVAELGADEVVEQSRWRITSAARTVLDCACTLPHLRAVAVGDAALHAGLEQRELAEALEALGRRIGIARARRVVDVVDGRSESVGESFSRIVLMKAGIPAPVLQLEITYGGSLIARSDFAWPELRTLGEFDGRLKYGRLLKPDEKPGDAVFREKLREDRLRDLGWQVVRWTWDDVREPSDLVLRLNRAFVRGRAQFPQA